MTRISVATLVLILTCVTPHAQNRPTFKSGTTLVQFTFVALDSKGNPITDLTKDDIVLTERGQTREVAFFRFDGNAPAAAANRFAPTAGFVTNRPIPDRNASAILLDLVNLKPTDQACVRTQILRYLKDVPSNSYAGIFRVSEFDPATTLAPFTNELDGLRARVKSLDLSVRLEVSAADFEIAHRGSPGTSGLQSEASTGARRANDVIARIIQEWRLKYTLAALNALGGHMAGIPGRKSLIWLATPMPMIVDDVDYTPKFREAAQRLATQGIAVYPVPVIEDCRVAAGIDAGGGSAEDTTGSADLIATITGGRLVRNTSDYTDAWRIAANDQRGTYTIGFYTEDQADDQWRQLKVDVKREGVRPHYQQGYRAIRRAAVEDWAHRSWNDLAYERLDATAIRLNGKADIARNEVKTTVQVQAGDLYFFERGGATMADLEIGLVEIGKKHNEATNVRVEPMQVTASDPAKDRQAQMIPVENTWPLNPDTIRLRVIVRDRVTGKYGTLELPVKR